MDLCKIYKLRRYYLQNTKRPKRCPAHVNITGTEQVNICFLIVSVTEQHLTDQIIFGNLTKMWGLVLWWVNDPSPFGKAPL